MKELKMKGLDNLTIRQWENEIISKSKILICTHKKIR
jgi:hypothetical protein